MGATIRLSVVLICLHLGLGAALAAPPDPTRVPLQLHETLGQPRHEVVTSGVPLPRGLHRNPTQAALVDSFGKPLPLNSTVLARWPDGSVKWLLIHTPVDLNARAALQCSLVIGQAPTRPSQQVQVADTLTAVTVTTGPMGFLIGKQGFRFIEQVWLDRNRNGQYEATEALLRPQAGSSWMEFEHQAPHAAQEENWLWDSAGSPREKFAANPDATDYSVKVEESGPARAVVCVRGFYRNAAGRKIAPFWVRYTANAGEAKIAVEHFFAFDGDPKTDFLRTLALRLPLKVSGAATATFGTQGAGAFAVPKGTSEASLWEAVPDRFYTCVPYRTDRTVPFTIEGKSGGTASTVLQQGKEASGWVRMTSGKSSVTVAMRDFWQLHPKELRVSTQTGDLDIYLWPDKGNKVLDLRRRYEGNDDTGHYDLSWYPEMGRGVGKTHQFVLDFSGAPALQTWASVQQPLMAFCEPQHYANTGLWGPFAVYDPERFPRWEARMEAGMEWLLRLPGMFHWDGMIDWGDTLFNGYEKSGHGQIPDKNVPPGSWVLRGYDGWMNNDTSFAEGLLIYFLRTGDRRVWQRFERMAQHVMDVDTIHCSAAPANIGGGHRHDEQHWGSICTGYGTACIEATDLYFLTGRRSALEMTRKYADWYTKGGNWCEWPNRIGCLVRAWEATGDEGYLKALDPEKLNPDYYVQNFSSPNFRMHSTVLSIAMYAAVMPNDWGRKLLSTGSRRLIEESAGNVSGLNLLAIAYLQDKDPDLSDWLRRFLATYDPYGTPVLDAFDYRKAMPGRAADLTWDELQEIVKPAGFNVQNSFGLLYMVLYQYPYVERALAQAGLTEKEQYLNDMVYRKKGWGWEWGMRGAKLPALPDSHFEPISIAGVANRNPLGYPLLAQDPAPTAVALKPGEIGFQFQESGPPVPGYLPVRWGTYYPRRAFSPLAVENDDRNLCGLPFGSTFEANGIPFDLPDPRAVAAGRTIIVLDRNQQVPIPIGKTVRRLHFFGHVCRKQTTAKEVGARYVLRYQDGTERSVDLVNMVDFEHYLSWGFARNAHFARNWKLHGGWDGDPFLINTYTLATEDKPLKEVVLEDTGKDYGFTLVGVTAEVAGADSAKAVSEVRFGQNDAGAARNAWQDAAAGGWTDTDLPLDQGAEQVNSHGTATWRMAAPDGDYDLELEMSGWGGNLGVNVIANGQLRVAAYCPTHQAAPGSPDFSEVIRFPVHVAQGRLDLTIANDAGAGTWWHPSPINTSKWALWSLKLLPATRPGPPALPQVSYGFVERDIQWLPQPWGLSEETNLDLAHTCLHSKSPKGTFRADVPAGQYELELVIGYTAARQQGQTPKMDVTLQGQQVLTDFVSPHSKEAKSLKFPVTVEAGKPLEVVFEPAGEWTEWGINALIVRPRQ
jgi:hypothetical protein